MSSCQEKMAVVGWCIVDISILDKSSIKIRFRHATFVVDPSAEGPKINSDAILLLCDRLTDFGRVADYRIVINAPGEYEIGEVKVTGVRMEDGLVYNIIGDGLSVVLGKTKKISKIKEEFGTECQVAVLNADSEFNQSILTTLEPKIVVSYGEKSDSVAKILGNNNLQSTKKFSITKDKLPQEREVVVLG